MIPQPTHSPNRATTYSAIVVMLAALASGCAARPEPAPKTPDNAPTPKESSADQLEANGDQARRTGDMTRAEEYFLLAIHYGGNARRLTQKVVTSCVIDGRYLLARDHAYDYVRKHPNDTGVRYILASLDLAAGEYDRARSELERVLEERPAMANAHYTLASLLKSTRRDPIEADEHFRAYLRLAPRGEFAEPARASLSRRTSR